MSNIDERTKQCEADITALQEQKQKLLAEKKEEYKFLPGDVVENIFGERRLITVLYSGKIIATDLCGKETSSENGNNFKNCDYKKIGKCIGFIVV